MSEKHITSDLVQEISSEEQQFLSGGWGGGPWGGGPWGGGPWGGGPWGGGPWGGGPWGRRHHYWY